MGCGPRYSMCPSQDSNQFLVLAIQSAGGGWFSVGSAFSLLLSELMALHPSGKFLTPKRAVIHLANTGGGKVTLYDIKV
jgi:hypothetical protein